MHVGSDRAHGTRFLNDEMFDRCRFPTVLFAYSYHWYRYRSPSDGEAYAIDTPTSRVSQAAAKARLWLRHSDIHLEHPGEEET